MFDTNIFQCNQDITLNTKDSEEARTTSIH